MRKQLYHIMLDIAYVLAQRATCIKKQVGCVITDEKQNIISTGYNGQPRGFKHCIKEQPCQAALDPNLSCMAIHAEINALIRCADPDKIHNVYITYKPCQKCVLAIANTNCRYVIYPDEFSGIIITQPWELLNGYATV